MVDSSKFGRLSKLPARQGWAGEAREFTPWLASNLDYLAKELGLALELREVEHPVGRYSLDMLLEDAEGRVVIVENQFEQTNHDHLGKLLTYCAGTEAQVVIWIAESMTEEHVAALEWLNENTISGVGFFGVELELLQIDSDGPMAPHFRVVAKPNEWSKKARRETVKASEWGWDAYGAELRVPAERLEVGRKLVEDIEAAIAERGLPWQKKFRKGYVAFQRSGGYNVVVVDLYWKKAPRFTVKLPAPPLELSLTSPYPGLEESWDPAERDWGWTIPRADLVPDVGVAIDIGRRYYPSSGPLTWEPGQS